MLCFDVTSRTSSPASSMSASRRLTLKGGANGGEFTTSFGEVDGPDTLKLGWLFMGTYLGFWSSW
jgi:hypothetical protein